MTSHLMENYAAPAVTFVQGNGTVLIDSEGNEYLDFLCGLSVTSLGHNRPEVTKAIQEQAATLSHVSNLFDHPQRQAVASLINDLLVDAGGRSGKVFFCNSGAEANECALKLARKARPGKHVVLTTLNSFHGRTLATLAATGQPEKQMVFAPMPEGFEHIAFGDLQAMEERLSVGDVAAVLVEVIQAEGGVNTPPIGYLPGLQEACRKVDALFMIDEVQTGLGRTGQWFGFQDENLAPDVVTLAKALGNGIPVGACWALDGVAAAFKPGDHGSTFGGQPLALAAAKATLETMIDLDAPALAHEASEQLRAGLLDLPGVTGVRGRGLILGAELNADIAKEVTQEALAAGVVVNAVRPNVIRCMPPLTVSADEIHEALRRLHAAMTKVHEQAGGE